MPFKVRRTWKFDYLVVDSPQWDRERDTHFSLREFEALDLSLASNVLDKMVLEDKTFVYDVAAQLFSSPTLRRPPPRSYDEARYLKQLTAELRYALGRGKSGETPRFARFHICRRKRSSPVLDAPDPWKTVRDAIDAAEQAPRGYVAIEVVEPDGAPLAGVHLEVLLADGQVRSTSTDLEGKARFDPIPQGKVHIRLPGLDGSVWKPAAGAPHAAVDRSRKTTHIVRQGECLSRIAHDAGIKDWSKVWNDPGNEALRKKRRDPNVLLPGDEVALPGRVVHELLRESDQSHRIIVDTRDTRREIILELSELDEEQELPGLDYELHYTHDGREVVAMGAIASTGRITAQLPLTLERAELRIPGRSLVLNLAIGHLNPALDEDSKVSCPSGVQARLRALGYWHGDIDDAWNDDHRLAVCDFQRTELSQKAPSGEFDDATYAQLIASYGA